MCGIRLVRVYSICDPPHRPDGATNKRYRKGTWLRVDSDVWYKKGKICSDNQVIPFLPSCWLDSHPPQQRPRLELGELNESLKWIWLHNGAVCWRSLLFFACHVHSYQLSAVLWAFATYNRIIWPRQMSIYLSARSECFGLLWEVQRKRNIAVQYRLGFGQSILSSRSIS